MIGRLVELVGRWSRAAHYAIADCLGFTAIDDPETCHHNFKPPRKWLLLHIGSPKICARIRALDGGTNSHRHTLAIYANQLRDAVLPIRGIRVSAAFLSVFEWELRLMTDPLRDIYALNDMWRHYLKCTANCLLTMWKIYFLDKPRMYDLQNVRV